MMGDEAFHSPPSSPQSISPTFDSLFDAIEFDPPSPRTPSPWPVDAPEWQDLDQLPESGQPVPMCWDQETDGWDVVPSSSSSPWERVSGSRMSMSPEDGATGEGWHAALDQDERLREILYRCVNDLQEFQATLDEDGSFFSREELMQERVEKHQLQIANTTWEQDLCIERVHLLIELLLSSERHHDQYPLSFVATFILRIPMIAAHIASSKLLISTMIAWLRSSMPSDVCPVLLHHWCKVSHEVIQQGVSPSLMVEYCRGLLPHLASPSTAALFCEVAQAACEHSHEQNQILHLLRSVLILPTTSIDMIEHACSVLAEILSSSPELGSSQVAGTILHEMLARVFTAGSVATLSIHVLELMVKMVTVEANSVQWREHGSGLFFQAAQENMQHLYALLHRSKGSLQLNTARLLCTMLQAPQCTIELSLELVQVISDVFLKGRANDVVRNTLLSGLGDAMQGMLTLSILEQTTVLVDTHNAYLKDFKAHDLCSREHLAMLCSFIVAEALPNQRCREIIEGVVPWGAFLEQCDLVSSECQHISNRAMSSMLEATFERRDPPPEGIVVY